MVAFERHRATAFFHELSCNRRSEVTAPLPRPLDDVKLTPEQQAEIEALRATRNETRRVTVPALEEILYEPMPVLDHGFVRAVDYMGDDSAIVQAARVSYGRGPSVYATTLA